MLKVQTSLMFRDIGYSLGIIYDDLDLSSIPDCIMLSAIDDLTIGLCNFIDLNRLAYGNVI